MKEPSSNLYLCSSEQASQGELQDFGLGNEILSSLTTFQDENRCVKGNEIAGKVKVCY